MKLSKSWLICVIAAGALASDAGAQAWDAPSFFSPRPMDDIGLYVMRTDRSVFSDLTGLVGIWRQSGNLNLGVRAGVGDLSDAGNTILIGAELYNSLNSLMRGSGLDLAWMLGAGAVFGNNYTFFSVPLGVSIGKRLGSGGISILPYVHPRVSFDIVAVDVAGEEETEYESDVIVDVGADVNLGSSFILRLGGSFVDRRALGVGLVLRWPRPISVGSSR